jgi:AraC family transcriptional regulator of arabinose operon
MDISRKHLYLSGMHPKMLALTTTTADITSCTPDWVWNNPGGSRDEVNLWLVTKGIGSLEIQEKVYKVGSGSCFFIRMGEPCRGRHDPSQPLTVLWSLCQLKQGWPTARERPAVYREVANLSFISQLYSLAIHSHNNPRSSRTETDMLMRAVFLAVAEEDSQAAASRAESRIPKILEIAERMRSRPGQSYIMAELARECACSTGHFSRLFRSATGMSPRAFITHSRISAARSMLRGSSHKIAHIGAELGYADIFHFSRQFKEKTGLSPSEYRA